MTEVVTGLGTLGYDSVAGALGARPGEMVSLAPETWTLLEEAFAGGGLSDEFAGAWANGRAFLAAADGLRGRRPVVVEWKGSHRAPGDEVAPIDLRIDHVYLVSCKYRSKILINASPFHLFERLLQGGHGVRSADWYEEVAPVPHRRLYGAVRESLAEGRLLPHLPGDLRPEERRALAAALAGGWPEGAEVLLGEFVEAVSVATAQRWQARTAERGAAERMLWRLLRMGSAPYFILGTSRRASLRLRVATPWDWRLQFRLRRFSCAPQAGGQPRVGWLAVVEDRRSRGERVVEGHVEIRWSHGRFSGNPEAKVYLDTAPDEVPGYFALR